MAVVEHGAPFTASAASRPAFVMRLASAANRMLRVWKNRRAARRLADLSDWELADIGLERSDVHEAFAFERGDPTLRLSRIVRSRHFVETAARRVN